MGGERRKTQPGDRGRAAGVLPFGSVAAGAGHRPPWRTMDAVGECGGCRGPARGAAVRPSFRPSFIARVAHGRAGAFTFAELLAAMVFVAIVIPVAVRAINVANRSGVAAERTRMAAELADRLLTELVVTGEWRNSTRDGDFGDSWPGYRYVIDNEAWEEDGVRVVSVEVWFDIQGQQHHVLLSTLAPETETVEEETL